MSEIAPLLTAASTVVFFSLFIGIVWWACSAQRVVANEEAAHLPFALPDEFKESQKELS